MATIDKKLIHFNRLADFEARLAAGDIRDYSIVCIKDAKKIWTHGEYYGDLSECLTKYPQEFTKEEKEQMLENLGYYFIEWDGESGIIELSEEEYRKVLSATNVYIVAMDVIYLFPTCKFNRMYRYTFIQEDGIVNFLLDISTNPMIITSFPTLIPKTTSELRNDSNFISSDNLKTINGEPILGEGNIELDTTISANATDDDVIVLTGTPGTNGVSYDAKHAKKFSTSNSTYTSGNSTTSISGSGGKGTIKIPQITVDSYGHVTAAADEDINITMPSVPTALPNPKTLTIQKNGTNIVTYNGSSDVTANITVPTNLASLTNDLKSLKVGSKSYNGSTEITITAADLGLSSALKYHGTTTTALTDGATTKPIVIGGSNHNQEQGCVVAYNNSSFVWTGSAWEELGNPGNYKVVQSAVSSPSASGNATAFIDTISLDANGRITVTKKSVQTASTSVYGITKLSSATDSTSEALAATPKAVKSAYDLASSKWTYNADTIKAVKVNAAGTADVANSVNWTNVKNKPTNLSQFNDDIVAGKYLPLTGGTIDGTLKVTPSDGYVRVIRKGNTDTELMLGQNPQGHTFIGQKNQEGSTVSRQLTIRNYTGPVYLISVIDNMNAYSYVNGTSGTLGSLAIKTLADGNKRGAGLFISNKSENRGGAAIGVMYNGMATVYPPDSWNNPTKGANSVAIHGDIVTRTYQTSYSNPYYAWLKYMPDSNTLDIRAISDDQSADYSTPIQIGDVQINGKSVIHSGNIGSQSVNYATSAGNATNALNTKRLVYNYTSPNVSLGMGEIAYSLVSGSDAGNLPVRYNANGVLTLNTHQGNYYYQLGFSSNGNIYGRFSEGSELSDSIKWKQIAFTDSNVASAKCLTAQQATTDDFGSYLSTYGAQGLSVIVNTSGAAVGNIGVMGSVLNIGSSTSRLGRFLFQRHEYSEALYWQSANGEGTGWGAKRTLAFTDSNVASATKLKTARTIWGQSFDGTGDVNGILTINSGGYIKAKDGNGYDRDILELSSDNTFYLGYGSAGAGGDTYLHGNNIMFRCDTSRTERMRITSSGNVGIGTTNPTEKLHVDGNVKVENGNFIGNLTGTADNSNAVNGTKIAIVSLMPASPDSSTLYFVK